jgi:hypothetical protein
MARTKRRKKPVPKDPKIYGYAVEYGYPPKDIPARPLFGNTLNDYKETFAKKVLRARGLILAAWR